MLAWMKLSEFPSVSSDFHPARALGGYPASPPNSLQCGRLKWDFFGIARSGLPMAEGMREVLCEIAECRMFTFIRSRPFQLQTVCVHLRGSRLESGDGGGGYGWQPCDDNLSPYRIRPGSHSFLSWSQSHSAPAGLRRIFALPVGS